MVFITRSVWWENAQKEGMNHTVFRIRDAVTAVKIWFRVTVKAQLIVYRNSSSRDRKFTIIHEFLMNFNDFLFLYKMIAEQYRIA